MLVLAEPRNSSPTFSKIEKTVREKYVFLKRLGDFQYIVI